MQFFNLRTLKSYANPNLKNTINYYILNPKRFDSLSSIKLMQNIWHTKKYANNYFMIAINLIANLSFFSNKYYVMLLYLKSEDNCQRPDQTNYYRNKCYF